MQRVFNQFKSNISRIRNLGKIYKGLMSQMRSPFDFSDILRAELVLAVSALDYFIHELARVGMIEAYQGNRVQSPAFSKFQINMGNVMQGISNPSDILWLEEEIRTRHSYQSFQYPEKIAEALRLISEKPLWNEVANLLTKDAQDIKMELRLIVERRNKIAHEADMDPSYPDKRWEIDEVLVDTAIDFIEKVAEQIYVVVT